MSIVTLLIWTIMSTALMAAGHFYLFRRLIHEPDWPTGWRRALSIGLVTLAISQPLLMVLSRAAPRDYVSPWAFEAYVWLGTLSTLFCLLVISDAIRLTLKLARGVTRRIAGDPAMSAGPQDPQRRSALKRLVAGGVAGGGSLIAGASVAHALDGFEVRELTIELALLPPALSGLRIVQLSDVHVGPTIGRSFVEAMVATSNSLKPDIVAITGDLVDGSVENLGKHTEPLKDLQSRYGTYFVTGNHEYYSGVESWLEELHRLGIRTLRNDAVRLGDGKDTLLLAGVTDYRAERYGDAPDLAHALRLRREGEEVLLLAHQPAEVHRAMQANVGLQLSGHTHGGQFWPWNWVVHLVQPIVSGLGRFGRTQVYVNTGTGYWGPPMRLGTQSEVTLITLQAPAA